MNSFCKISDLPGVILAGGRSTRMGGGDKSLIEINGKTLLKHVIDRLGPQVGRLVLNANGDKSRFEEYNLPIISDSFENYVGPLAGVLSGMDWASKLGYKSIVTVAADTPFFPKNLVYKLHNDCKQFNSSIGLATTFNKKSNKKTRHPTFGHWQVSLRHDLRAALHSGVRKVVLWTESKNGIDIIFEETNQQSFFNVNTREDLLEAKKEYGLLE